MGDDADNYKYTNFSRRKGEEITISDVTARQLLYQNRMFTDPVPNLWTDSGWRSINFMRALSPTSLRNMITNLVRFKEQRKSDLTYIYMPTMRRVLRGEAGQRATQVGGSTQAPDDFNGAFAGRIPTFTYKYIGKKAIVALGQAQVTYSKFTKDMNYDYFYIEEDNWELRDVYIIDVFSKDPTYPQGRKRLWIDKETCFALYSCAWDRSGAIWKVWQTAVCPVEMNNGGTFPYMRGMLGVDIQLGYGVQMIADWNFNGNGVRETDVNVSAMRRVAR